MVLEPIVSAPDDNPFHLDGLTDLPAGKLAAIVTYLEMSKRPASRRAAPRDCALLRIERPGVAWYRALFRQIGDDHLWWSRLKLDDDALASVLNRPTTHVFVARQGGTDVGLLELDAEASDAVEIAFFGVVSGATGRGLGRWMMTEALDRAFALSTGRVWLHTCTLDHPAALRFYLAAGFKPYKRAVEIFDDPRLLGLIPTSTAPHHPLITADDERPAR